MANPTDKTKQKELPSEIEVDIAGAMFKGEQPTIILTVNSPEIIPDSIICHELWHLLLFIQSGIYNSGYASPLFDAMISKIPNERKLIEVFTHAHTILHHTYIFQKMLESGYNLQDSFARFFEDRKFYLQYSDETKYFHMAIDAWHLRVAQNDTSFNTSIYLETIKYKSLGSFSLGLRLQEISKEYTDPADEPEVFKKILSEIFEYRKPINFVKGNKDGTYNLGIYH